MKRIILNITALSLFAAVIVATPAVTCAADANNAPAGTDQTATAKHKSLPFHGKLSAIDTNAMTLSVGERTFEITSETKIMKDGQPATLSEGVVGEPVGGAYKKGEDGKLTATSIRFGAKPEGEPKKKKKTNSDDAGSLTNSPAN